MDLDRQSLASFRVLVAVARADGTLTDEEQQALKASLGRHSDILPGLLAEDTDVDAELAQLTPEARKALYQSAFALSYADGNASVQEVNLLKRIVPNDGERSLLGQVFGETLDTVVPGRIVAEADPAKREMEILEDTIKYSVLAAVAGAMPVPGVAIVADLAVIGLQAKLVHDIGQYWGHQMDMAAIRAFLGTVAGSAGLRIAVNNLARFVPGWGSAFGAATSFATTFAIGRVASRYFEAGRGLDEAELRSLFEQARGEGRSVFDTQEQRIAAARAQHGQRLAELNEQLASGRLSRAEYDRQIASLGLS